MYNSAAMKKTFRVAALLVAFSFLSFAQTATAPVTAPDVSQSQARPVVDWARDGIVYEVFERQFSREGTFNGVTARLDALKKSGVALRNPRLLRGQSTIWHRRRSEKTRARSTRAQYEGHSRCRLQPHGV